MATLREWKNVWKHCRFKVGFIYQSYTSTMGHLLKRQCKFVVMQRIQRAQRIALLYSRIWNEAAVRKMVQRWNTRRWRNRFMLGAGLVAKFTWNEERIPLSFMERHVDDVDSIHELIEETLVCVHCHNRKAFDGKREGVSYCTCRQTAVKWQDHSWQPFLERAHVTVWRKPYRGNIYEYKVHGGYADVSAKSFSVAMLDMDFRSQWDVSAIDLTTVDEDPDSNAIILYSVMKYPFPLTHRDYVFKRSHWFFPEKKTLVLVNQSTTHPKCPLNNSYMRIAAYQSVMTIRACGPSFEQPTMEFTLHYYDDPGVQLPTAFVSYVSMFGFQSYLSAMYEAALKVERGQHISKINDLLYKDKSLATRLENLTPKKKAVAHLRIPRPSDESVCSILGPAWDEDEAENVMDVIGHRGACLDAPENSLSAFRKCKEQGVKGVELDVSLSKDGVAFVFHDDTFDRITEATGPVSSLTWKQVQELNIKPPPGHENEFEKEKIPTLTEALNTCLDLGLKVIIDVKDPTLQAADVVLEMFKTIPNLHHHAMVSSFFPNIIYRVRKEDPQIACSMAYRPWFFSHGVFTGQRGPSSPRFRHFKHILAVGLDLIMHWAFMHLLADFLGLSAVLLHKDSLHRYEATRWKAKGLRVYAWTVNSPTEKRYFLEEVQVPILTDTLFPSVRKKPAPVSS